MFIVKLQIWSKFFVLYQKRVINGHIVTYAKCGVGAGYVRQVNDS